MCLLLELEYIVSQDSAYLYKEVHGYYTHFLISFNSDLCRNGGTALVFFETILATFLDSNANIGDVDMGSDRDWIDIRNKIKFIHSAYTKDVFNMSLDTRSYHL